MHHELVFTPADLKRAKRFARRHLVNVGKHDEVY